MWIWADWITTIGRRLSSSGYLNGGDVPDIRNCRRYYEDGKVKKVLLAAKFLTEYRLHI